MKKLLLLNFILFTVITCNAQDLIITTLGDSIDCIITRVNRQYIYFALRVDNKTTTSLIPVPLVSEYFRGGVASTSIDESELSGNDFDKFRCSFNMGLGYRINKISNGLSRPEQEYLKGLRAGFTMNTEGSIFFDENSGMGLKYSIYKSGNSVDNLFVNIPGGYSGRYRVENKITVHFLGPSLHHRTISLNKRSSRLYSFSAGYVGYKDRAIINYYYTITGKTLGLSMGLKYDYHLDENVAIGFEISMLAASLHKITLDNGFSREEVELDQDEYEGLSRIDVTIGVRF